LQELLEAGAVFLGVAGVRVGDVGEDLGGEARDLVVADAAVLRKCVADAEFAVADEADDIARPGFVHRLALAAEKLVGRGETDGFAVRWCVTTMSRSKLARADAAESDAIAMLRVHVGLDLEDEAGELRIVDRHSRAVVGWGKPGTVMLTDLRGAGGTESLRKAVEQELDAEVVHRGAEVDGRLLAGLHGLEVERVARAVEHRELVLHLLKGVASSLLRTASSSSE